MTVWQEWLRRPQRLWLRRAVFQIHLWTGIGVGVYVVLISVSGSAIVYRPELLRAFARRPAVVAVGAERMTEEELRDAARRAHPGYEVSEVWGAKKPDLAVEVWLEREGDTTERLFDPYTGQDLGAAVAPGVRVVNWLISFHDNLLFDRVGRTVNGVGALFLVLLCVTGAVIWWPGTKTWRRSLVVPWRRVNWQRFNWHLHSAIGFWAFAMVFMWAVTGVSLAFPQLSADLVDYFEPPGEATVFPRRGDTILAWFGRLHFGRFFGRPLRMLWVILGLVPPALFVSGAIMWWHRVAGPRVRQFRLSRRAHPLSPQEGRRLRPAGR